jgi:hypothetical protein
MSFALRVVHPAPNECKEPGENERYTDFEADLRYFGREESDELQNESQSNADVCICLQMRGHRFGRVSYGVEKQQDADESACKT